MSTRFVKFSLVQQQKCEVYKPSSVKRGKLLVTAPLLTLCPPESKESLARESALVWKATLSSRWIQGTKTQHKMKQNPPINILSLVPTKRLHSSEPLQKMHALCSTSDPWLDTSKLLHMAFRATLSPLKERQHFYSSVKKVWPFCLQC